MGRGGLSISAPWHISKAAQSGLQCPIGYFQADTFIVSKEGKTHAEVGSFDLRNKISCYSFHKVPFQLLDNGPDVEIHV